MPFMRCFYMQTYYLSTGQEPLFNEVLHALTGNTVVSGERLPTGYKADALLAIANMHAAHPEERLWRLFHDEHAALMASRGEGSRGGKVAPTAAGLAGGISRLPPNEQRMLALAVAEAAGVLSPDGCAELGELRAAQAEAEAATAEALKAATAEARKDK